MKKKLRFFILIYHLVLSQTGSISGNIKLDNGDVSIVANIFIINQPIY